MIDAITIRRSPSITRPLRAVRQCALTVALLIATGALLLMTRGVLALARLQKQGDDHD